VVGETLSDTTKGDGRIRFFRAADVGQVELAAGQLQGEVCLSSWVARLDHWSIRESGEEGSRDILLSAVPQTQYVASPEISLLGG
jgi:hypothetical protein